MSPSWTRIDRASPDVRAKAFGRALPRRLGYVLDEGDKAVAVDKRSDAYPVPRNASQFLSVLLPHIASGGLEEGPVKIDSALEHDIVLDSVKDRGHLADPVKSRASRISVVSCRRRDEMELHQMLQIADPF